MGHNIDTQWHELGSPAQRRRHDSLDDVICQLAQGPHNEIGGAPSRPEESCGAATPHSL